MASATNNESEGKGEKAQKKFPIFINDAKYFVTEDQMTGAQLKELGGIPTGNRLFKELPGKKPDLPVGDDMVVQLKAGDKFYDLPVGVVGGDSVAQKR